MQYYITCVWEYIFNCKNTLQGGRVEDTVIWAFRFFFLLLLVVVFWLHCSACRNLVPWPKSKPRPLQWKYLFLTHWTNRELLKLLLLCCSYSVAVMDWSTTGFPVLNYLPEFAQTHVHWVSDAIQPSHPLLPPSSPALNLSQHQGLFQRDGVWSLGQ